jgi:hypothetical protein
MGLAYALLYVALLFVRMRTEISQRRLRTIRMGLEAEPA